MAGKPLKAAQIRKILEMCQNGVSNRKIALSTGIGRKAVNRHVNYIKSNGLDAGALRELDDTALDAVFHKGDPAYADPRMEDFIGDIEIFRAERDEEGMNVNRMWLNYKTRRKEEGKKYYEITQFRLHLARANLLPPTKIHVPANTADYALSAIATTRSFETSHIDYETGEVLTEHVVAVYMTVSEYIGICHVESLSISKIVGALNEIFINMGGCPAMLDISDLLKVCSKPKDVKQSVVSIMRQMLSYCGIKPYTPAQSETRAREHMERAFNHLTHRLPGTKRPKTEEVHTAVDLFKKRYNRTRIRKRSLSREEDFLRNEKPRLSPLPPAEYEVGRLSVCKAHVDGTVQVGKGDASAYYSVPLDYIGEKVSCIRGTRSILILDGDRLIAAHHTLCDHQYSLKEEHVEQWEGSVYNDFKPFEYSLFNLSPTIADWVARFFERLVKSGLKLQECVRKYENIERTARQDPSMMSSFCEMYACSEIESYHDFVRAFRGYKESAYRGTQWGRSLFAQK